MKKTLLILLLIALVPGGWLLWLYWKFKDTLPVDWGTRSLANKAQYLIRRNTPTKPGIEVATQFE